MMSKWLVWSVLSVSLESLLLLSNVSIDIVVAITTINSNLLTVCLHTCCYYWVLKTSSIEFARDSNLASVGCVDMYPRVLTGAFLRVWHHMVSSCHTQMLKVQSAPFSSRFLFMFFFLGFSSEWRMA